MPDKFDPYREALVMEELTIWPEGYEEVPVVDRQRIEQALHAEPSAVGQLEYVRTHTGFCRTITVTAEDYERLAS